MRGRGIGGGEVTRRLRENFSGGPPALICPVASRVEEGRWCYTRQEEPGGDGGEMGDGS